MYLHDNVYRSLIYHASRFAPSGVAVVEGESYGIRSIDPRAKNPSITVTLKDTDSAEVELGSDSLSFQVVYTISAKSRQQRDALKDVVYQGITKDHVPVYSAFNEYVPASGASVIRTGKLGDYIKITDMPMFETDRERLFWTAVVFVDYVLP